MFYFNKGDKIVAIRQVISCCVCGKEEKEKSMGDGFVGWGTLQGIALNGEPNPNMCPEHLEQLATALDVIAGDPQHIKNRGGL